MQKNISNESLIDIISTLQTEIISIEASENEQMENGVINIMNSRSVTITGGKIYDNIPKLISGISILQSKDINIDGIQIYNNKYVHDYRLVEPSLKANYKYYSSPLLANSSSVILTNVNIHDNKVKQKNTHFQNKKKLIKKAS